MNKLAHGGDIKFFHEEQQNLHNEHSLKKKKDKKPDPPAENLYNADYVRGVHYHGYNPYDLSDEVYEKKTPHEHHHSSDHKSKGGMDKEHFAKGEKDHILDHDHHNHQDHHDDHDSKEEWTYGYYISDANHTPKKDKDKKKKKLSYKEKLGLADFIREGGVDLDDFDADLYKDLAHTHEDKEKL